MSLCEAEDPNARFAIDVYPKDGSGNFHSTFSTERASIEAEINRLGPMGNFERIEVFEWVDDVEGWGDPIEIYEPEDF